MIEHEGSSSPRDPKKPAAPGTLVLDIEGQAPQPSQYVRLMLRKPDKRRSSTQHWEFTDDGRLKCCMYANLYVQIKDGFGDRTERSEKVSDVGPWQMSKEEAIRIYKTASKFKDKFYHLLMEVGIIFYFVCYSE